MIIDQNTFRLKFVSFKFIVDNKYKNLYELIDNHIYNIQSFINTNRNKLNENHLIRIEKFLKMEDHVLLIKLNMIVIMILKQMM